MNNDSVDTWAHILADDIIDSFGYSGKARREMSAALQNLLYEYFMCCTNNGRNFKVADYARTVEARERLREYARSHKK